MKETKRHKYVSRGVKMENKVYNGFEIVQDLIKLRWVPEIIKSIKIGNCKYNEILRSIPYISNTELNRKLTVLIDKKVINKAADGYSSDYSLLGFGEDLAHIFNHLECLEDKYFENTGREVHCSKLGL